METAKQILNAGPLTHWTALAIAFVGITYHQFSQIPQFQTWIGIHWATAALISSIKVAAPIIALYTPRLSPAKE